MSTAIYQGIKFTGGLGGTLSETNLTYRDAFGGTGIEFVLGETNLLYNEVGFVTSPVNVSFNGNAAVATRASVFEYDGQSVDHTVEDPYAGLQMRVSTINFAETIHDPALTTTVLEVTEANPTDTSDVYWFAIGGDALPNISTPFRAGLFVESIMDTASFFDDGDAMGVVPFNTSPSVIVEADESFVGGDGSEFWVGNTGRDTADGGGGIDRLNGGAGKDNLSGGADNDLIDGGAGVDRLYGGDGDDELRGREKGDLMFGEAGNDVMSGGLGADEMDGGSGDDTMDGGAGTDTLRGDAGNDIMEGAGKRDFLFGGLNDDVISGGAGFDRLFGGSGDDILDGGSENDRMTGGTGNDIFVFAAGCDDDLIRDFEDDVDTLRLSSDLWEGDKTAAQVIADHSVDVAGSQLLVFDSGDSLVLAGIDNLSVLIDDIEIVDPPVDIA